LKQEPKRIKKF